MGKLAKGTNVLSITMVSEKFQYIRDRAEKSGGNAASFGHAIVDYWVGHGAPSLHPNDRPTPVPDFPPMPSEKRAAFRMKLPNSSRMAK